MGKKGRDRTNHTNKLVVLTIVRILFIRITFIRR